MRPNCQDLFAPLSGTVARRIRRKSGLNQINFWTIVGVTQSCGSRYESGERDLPKPVRAMVRIVHVWGIRPIMLEYIARATKKALKDSGISVKRLGNLIRFLEKEAR